MTKTLLLGAAAALAFSVGGASAAAHHGLAMTAKGAMITIHAPKTKTLVDQNDDSQGYSDISQNFESSLDAYDAQGSDDFTVPKNTTWTVTEVDVTGLYFNGTGPARDENVTFYSDKKGKPGKIVKEVTVAGTDTGGSFAINLGKKGVKLTAGKYWVSVQANMDYASATTGEWGWATRIDANGNNAQWQNPGDGFATGCTKWSDEQTCLGGVGGPDHMFALLGSAKKGK